MVGKSMGKAVIKTNNWPFAKGEKAKLVWIGEPIKKNNKWMFYAYFRANNITRKILLDWASIHFLSVDKYYIDGNLNNGESIEDSIIMDINLGGIKADYREKDWELRGSGFYDKTKSKTFNFLKNGSLFTIPIIEIIRAVLAPNQFLLNRILEKDILENYFTYDITPDKLTLHFTSEYEEKLLKSEKVNQLAWILTNPDILKMFRNIATNLREHGELRYEFLFDKFNIKARVVRKNSYVRVLQILSLKKKTINVDEINVYHPSQEILEASDEPKKRKYVSQSNYGIRTLDPHADGSTKNTEEIKTFIITHEYEHTPKIIKVQSGRKLKRVKENKNTKTYVFEDKGLRTTADTGGEDLLRGLEFKNIAKINEKGELEEFIEILRLLEKREDVKSVEVIIGELSAASHGKKFSLLNDGITKRKYAIGKICMINGREISFIDIEREDKSLSMLVLRSHQTINWKSIFNILLYNLVNDSGKWSNAVIERFERIGILIHRMNHTKKDIFHKKKAFYKMLV